MRFAGLVPKGVFDQELFQALIEILIQDFIDRFDYSGMAKGLGDVSAKVTGGAVFTYITGINLGKIIASGFVASLFSGFLVGTILNIGAEQARSVYSSRNLKSEKPLIYQKLRQAGDLDLLYFIVKDQYLPFEDACAVSERKPEKFRKICKYFIEGLGNEN